MTTSSAVEVAFYKRGGLVHWCGDSASIKLYDNRARLIPLPIINAGIKLEPVNESTESERSLPSLRIMIWIIYQTNKGMQHIVLNFKRQALCLSFDRSDGFLICYDCNSKQNMKLCKHPKKMWKWSKKAVK